MQIMQDENDDNPACIDAGIQVAAFILKRIERVLVLVVNRFHFL